MTTPTEEVKLPEMEARPNNAVLVPASELRKLQEDAGRLDWLEARVYARGSLLLHDGDQTYGLGFNLRPGSPVRTIRAAIDAARQTTREQP